MKNRVKKYLQNPMIIVFIIILLFLTPQAIYSPGQNRDKGIVIAIGIDRDDNDYEISFLTFIPTAQQSYKEMSSVISGKGESIAKALYNAQIAMGRKIGLSHAKTTVVNEELLQEDVSEHIDYLSRVASLPENTVFICTDSTAKELLKASFNLVSSIGLQLEQIIGYNAKNLYVTDTSLEAFYKGYYSYVKSSLIGYLSLVDESSSENETNQSEEDASSQVDVEGTGNGGDGSSPNGSTDNSSTSQSSKGKHILNKGEAVLIKNGKMVEKLTVDQLNGINLLNRESINQIVKIKDVQLEGKKLNLSYRIKNKLINTVLKFENGLPIYGAQLILGLELVEIEGEHENLKINTEFSTMTPEIIEKLDAEIKRQFTDALKILRINKTDVIGITEAFFKTYRKEFTKLVNQIDEVDNFINYVNFKLSLVLQSD